MDKRKIVEEIDKDIARGIYDMFPKLKDRLTFIRRKVYSSIYLINGEPLSKGELKTLQENEYITIDDDEYFNYDE